MNDDELRDHLRSTLEPVSSPTPELARLRRVARRRRRRLQATAGGLGLLLVAGAGIGIAEAISNNSGRSELTVGSPPPAPAEVTVPCQSGHVSLAVGQVLRVEPCAEVGYGVFNDMQGLGSPFVQAGPQSFRATGTGTSPLTIRYTGPCPPSPACDLKQNGVGTITVTVVAPSHSSAPVLVASVVSAPCKGGHVAMVSGGELTLANCPVGVSSHIDDPAVLAPGTSPNTFTAKRAGTTNVELFVKPQCSPGMMCPQYVRGLGTLVVTVTAD